MACNDERLTFTITEAMSALGVSKHTLYEAIRTGNLPTIRMGRPVMIPKHALLEFMGTPSPIPTIANQRNRSYEDGVADERSRITELLVKLLAEVRGY